MRFALLHKVASYLLAISGFAALALSGELPPAALLLTVVVGAASFLLEPSRQALLRTAAWTTGWNVASLLVAAWTAFSVVLRGEPFLIEGVQFLCFLLANKLCNRRASRDYLQIYVLSFLMLIAGTTLNTNLVFAPIFLAYVVCATWALTLLHLRREIEENYLLKHSGGDSSERVEVERVLGSRRVVGGTFLAVTSVMSAGIFAVSAVFFFAFPRIGWNAFFRHQRHGLSVGFSDHGVALGDNGLIKDNEQVVMRVEFPAGRPFRPLYLRGISFERYRDGRWTPAPSDVLRRHALRRSAGFTLVGVAAGPRRYETHQLQKRLAGSTELEIYLEPMDASVLFAASSPVALSVQNRNQALGAPSLAIEGAWLEHGEDDDQSEATRTAHATDDIYAYRYPGGIRYTAWSRLAPPDDKALAASTFPTAARRAELAEYLDVETVPPRVLALARRITEGAATPTARAQAIQRYLTRELRYSLKLVHDARKEPIEEFLFDRKEGHCEYFASAMALLLRAVGVPSRHVAGFYGGEWNQVGRYLQVRQRDAHAWVEAWLGDDLGWVTFDPTPVTASVEMRSGVADRVRQMIDVMELAWFKYVIEYDLGTQMDLIARLRRWLQGRPQQGGRAPRPDAPASTPPLRRILELLGALCTIGLGAWVVVRRRPQLARLVRRGHVTTRGLERAMRALEQRGCERGPGDTPMEVSRRAEALGDPGAAAFAELVELYHQARFGRRAVDPSLLASLVAQVVRPPAAGAE